MQEAVLLRVLVVDDSARMRQAIINTLRAIRWCSIVGEGTNGLEALQLARDMRPDLVIMDINMPVMGGLEAMRLLKRELPCIHIVMVSTTLEPDTRAVALKDGATACLEKSSELWNGLKTIVLLLSQTSEARPPSV